MQNKNSIFNLKSMSGKIFLYFSILVIIILTINMSYSYYMILQREKSLAEEYLSNMSNLMYSEIKNLISTSIKNYLRGIAEEGLAGTLYYYKEYKAGKLSERVAKQKAMKFLLSKKIGYSGYFYCLNHKGVLQVHPKPSLINADVSKYGFVKLQTKQKNGYFEYMWKNPGEKEKRAKAGYMVYFKEWDWIITASSYRKEFYQLFNINTIKKEIMHHKFGESGYCYIFDLKGKAILHPTHDGKSIYNWKDTHGKFFIQDMIKMKNGYIEYFWQDPIEKKISKKLVYFKYLKEFNWIIAVSSYYKDIHKLQRKMKIAMPIRLLISIILIGVFIYFFSYKITKPLKHLSEQAKIIADGDLTKFSESMELKNSNEIGILSNSINYLTNNLRQIIREITNVSKDVSAYSNELEKSAESLSEKSQQQAGSVEEISSSISKIKISSEEISSLSQEINEKSQNVVDSIQDIETTSNSAIRGMENIEKSSNEINEIISVIEEITDQTNLLSLNASIEAARAGEAGRGFSVVANEISNLAEKSNKATKKITELIKNTENDIQIGSNKIKGLHEAILNIAETSKLAQERSSKIVISTKKQVLSTEIIDKEMEQVNEITNVIASLSEEQNSAIILLGKEAEKLVNLILKFKT